MGTSPWVSSSAMGPAVTSDALAPTALHRRYSSAIESVLGEGISTRISPAGFAFLQDVSDASLQQVEIEPTSIADNLPESFVDRGEVLANISQKFLLLTRSRYFLRFSHQVTDHGIFGP